MDTNVALKRNHDFPFCTIFYLYFLLNVLSKIIPECQVNIIRFSLLVLKFLSTRNPET